MSFWTGEFDPPHPPLYDQLVEDAQGMLGVRLPESYLQLLSKQNGGYVDEQLVPVDAAEVPEQLRPHVSDGFVSIGSLFGIGDADEFGDIRCTPYLLREWSLPDGLVLIDGDGHAWIALDYRGYSDNDPPVIFIESETGASLRLANSFSEFVASFVPYEAVYDEDGELISDPDVG